MNARRTQERSTFQLLTGPGPAGLAVLRLCGPQVAEFLKRHVLLARGPAAETWQVGDVWRAKLVDTDGAELDEILVSTHVPSPQRDVRLSTHGSPALMQRLRKLLVGYGFSEVVETISTLWIDVDTLTGETYALLPRMLTLRGARWLLDHADKLHEALCGVLATDSLARQQELCRSLARRTEVVDWFAHSARIVVVGPPNAGKSTLVNALAARAVSVVSPEPGTTRDWVDVPTEIKGFPVTWIDTAGLRRGGDGLEVAGAHRTQEWIATEAAVLIVLDATADASGARAEFVQTYGDLRPVCVAMNKADVAQSLEAVIASLPSAWQSRVAVVSASRRKGLDELQSQVLKGLGRDEGRLDVPGAFTDRQTRILTDAGAAADASALRAAVSECLGGAGARESGGGVSRQT